MVSGLLPLVHRDSLYIAIGILGATVMPHNLYLHSALVQTRDIGRAEADKRAACRYNLIDSAVALNGAMLVNAAILIMAAAVFFKRGIVVTEIQQAHQLLAPLLGTGAASVMFAVALICSGQSSTLTGTLAGQIVMEGFLNFRMRPWLRRLITRMLAIAPAALTIYLAGDGSIYRLLILSQVILSMQLPFAIIPLIHFTNDRQRMGNFANARWVRVLAWITAAVIVGLNARLALMALSDWLSIASPWQALLWVVTIPLAGALVLLLVWITLQPYVARWRSKLGRASISLPDTAGVAAAAPAYQRILVPLDHSVLDGFAVSHATAMAKQYGARIYLLHIEEDVTSRVYGEKSSTAEVEAGEQYLGHIAQSIRNQGISVETSTAHGGSPAKEIVRYAGEVHPDLVIMGAHGHGGLKDLIFGNTITPVRHHLSVPMLIVRPPVSRTSRPA
jgi:manganese transport protein